MLPIADEATTKRALIEAELAAMELVTFRVEKPPKNLQPRITRIGPATITTNLANEGKA